MGRSAVLARCDRGVPRRIDVVDSGGRDAHTNVSGGGLNGKGQPQLGTDQYQSRQPMGDLLCVLSK